MAVIARGGFRGRSTAAVESHARISCGGAANALNEGRSIPPSAHFAELLWGRALCVLGGEVLQALPLFGACGRGGLVVEAERFLQPEAALVGCGAIVAARRDQKALIKVLGEGEVGGDAVLVPGGHVTLLKLRCVHPIT